MFLTTLSLLLVEVMTQLCGLNVVSSGLYRHVVSVTVATICDIARSYGLNVATVTISLEREVRKRFKPSRADTFKGSGLSPFPL